MVHPAADPYRAHLRVYTPHTPHMQRLQPVTSLYSVPHRASSSRAHTPTCLRAPPVRLRAIRFASTAPHRPPAWMWVRVCWSGAAPLLITVRRDAIHSVRHTVCRLASEHHRAAIAWSEYVGRVGEHIRSGPVALSRPQSPSVAIGRHQTPSCAQPTRTNLLATALRGGTNSERRFRG